MKKLLHLSVYHPLSVLMILLGIILLCFVSMFFIPVNSMPFIKQEHLIVFTNFDGASVEEIEKFITIPLEEALSSLKGVKNIQSISRNGKSIITLELHWDTDVDVTIVNCSEIIDEVYQVLPKNCNKPKLLKEEYNNLPSLIVALVPGSNDEQSIFDFLDEFSEKHLKYEIQRLESVGMISIFGSRSKEIAVLVDKEKADSYGFSLSDISESIKFNNFQYPAGFIKEGEKSLLLKTTARLKNEDELKEIPLFVNDTIVTLDSFCKVENTIKDKESFYIYNGKNCVCLQIYAKKGKSPLVISSQVKKLVKKINTQYGKVFTCEIIYDEGCEVLDSLYGVLFSTVIGACATFVVISMFYSSAFIASILASIIPLCVIFSSSVLFLCGKSFNLMSLSGIAIGIGMVVDASSVIIDEIISQRYIRGVLEKKDIENIVNSLYMSNLGSTVTTIVVFIPIFFIKGILIGIFFDLVIAIISALFFALILSFTFIPGIFSLVQDFATTSGYIDNQCTILIDRYAKHIKSEKVSLKALMFLLFVFFVLGIVLCGCIKKEFFPKISTKEINFNQYYPENMKIAYIEEDARKFISVLENIYWKNHQVFEVTSIEGGKAIFNPLLLKNPEIKEKMISWKLKINSKIKKATAYNLLEALFAKTTLKEVLVEKSSFIEHIFDGTLKGFAVSDDSFEKAKKISEELKTEKGVIFPYEKDLVQCFVPNVVKIAQYALTASDIAYSLYTATEGSSADFLYKNEDRIPITVKYDVLNTDRDFIKQLLIFNPDKKGIYLDSLGMFINKQEYNALFRYNRKPAFILSDIKGESKNVLNFEKIFFDEIVNNGLLIIIGIFFILYFILAAQFESFKLPFLVLLSCIPAFAGALLCLFICNESLNCNSLIALIILFGTVVNNVILLFESCIQSKEKKALDILEACCKKTRTIVVTTLTTVIALIPFVFNFTGKNMQTSLAIALIGGLISSVIFVLWGFPYFLVRFFQSKRNEYGDK